MFVCLAVSGVFSEEISRGKREAESEAELFRGKRAAEESSRGKREAEDSSRGKRAILANEEEIR